MCVAAVMPILAGAASYGAGASVGLSGLGLALTTASGVASGLAAGQEYEAAKYNQQLAEQQKKQLETESENVRIAASQESAQVYTEAQKKAARARAYFAGSGIATGTGTAAQIGEEIAGVGAFDQMTLLSNAQRRAMGLETEGQNLVDRAKMQKRSAKFGLAKSLITSPLAAYTMGA